MATSTEKRISVNIKLNDGLDTKGNVKTVGVSLGSLSLSGYNDDKALAVVSALEDCFSKEVYSIEKTHVTSIASDE